MKRPTNTGLLDVILTDTCSKSNKRINYFGVRDSSELVEIKTSNISSWNFLQNLNSMIKDIFLPKGYPDSVSKDYLEYQIWDTCQAFCSSISGTLTMRAVMQGIGVGSEAATPISAAMTWIMKDGTGIIGSILFAWLKGSKFDSDCKKWRLFADVLNNVALFVELYIPFVMDYSLYMLCLATIFKALVGTAGSSTRAALITHQAIKGNIADVSAKDGSQEIFTNLCAFVFGILILKNVTETEHVWTVMYTATLFHLIFNYKAVRCLQMNVFNSERFCLCLRTYLPTSSVPTIAQINRRESVFLFTGVSENLICGFSVVFGASLKSVIQAEGVTAIQLSTLAAFFQEKKYLIIPNLGQDKLYVAFGSKFNERDVLKAYFHSQLIGICLTHFQKKKVLDVMSRSRKNSPVYRLKNILQESSHLTDENPKKEQRWSHIIMQSYSICEDFVEKEFLAFCRACKEEGWSTEKHLINIDDWQAEWKCPRDTAKDHKKRIKNTVTFKPNLSPKEPKMSVDKNMGVLVIS